MAHRLPPPQKAHKPTEELRATVQRAAAFGFKHDQIAGILGINDDTLRKYYPEELRTGRANILMQVAESLYRKALRDDAIGTTAAIFLMKTQGRWAETVRQEHSGPEGGPIETVQLNVDELDADARSALRRAIQKTKAK